MVANTAIPRLKKTIFQKNNLEKLLTAASGQFFNQILTFLTGILIVRGVSPAEYGTYTLANALFSTLTVISDSGIGSSVLFKGGQVWKDKERLGIVLASGTALKNRFAIVAACCLLPVGIYLLINHGTTLINTLLIVVALIPSFYATISTTLLAIIPRVHQEIKDLSKNQIVVTIIRLLCTTGTLFLFPFTPMLLAASAIAQIIGNIQLKKLVNKHAKLDAKQDVEIVGEIFAKTKRIMPTTIYFAVSGQITIWLVSILGTSSQIGSIGALGRIAMVYTLLTSTFNMLIVPRFSRKDEGKGVTRTFLFLQGILFVIGLSAIVTFYLFSDWILLILGNNYKHLGHELFIVTISSTLTFIGQCTNQLLTSRGIIVSPALLIGSVVSCQILFLIFFQLTTLTSFILFGALSSLVIYIIRIIYFIRTSILHGQTT